MKNTLQLVCERGLIPLPICFAALVYLLCRPALAPAQTLEVHESAATDTQTTSRLQTYWADHSYDRWYNPHSKRVRITIVDTTQRSPLAKVYILFVARKKSAAELSIYNYAILTANFLGEPQLSGEIATPALGPEEKDPKGADVAGWIAIGRSGPSIFGIAASDQALLDIAKSGALRSLISTAEDSSKLAVLTKGEGARASIAPSASIAPTPAEVATLTAPTEIALPYGKTTLPRGTKLKIVSRNAQTVTVQYLDSTASIPISATDLR